MVCRNFIAWQEFLALDIKEFKLRVSGKRQGLTVVAEFAFSLFVSCFLSYIKRIIRHYSFETTSPFARCILRISY